MSAKDAMVKFLKKLKSMDSVPEEVIDAACEMADESTEGEVIEETKDESAENIEKIVNDAISKALKDAGLVRDESMSALDALDEELKENNEVEEEEEEIEDAEGEESVTVDPKEIKDSSDSIRKIIAEIKPQIASIKDAGARKKLADSVAKLAKAQKTTTTDYSSIMKAVSKNKASAARDAELKKSMINDYEVGSSIAAKFNPHYKKEVK